MEFILKAFFLIGSLKPIWGHQIWEVRGWSLNLPITSSARPFSTIPDNGFTCEPRMTPTKDEGIITKFGTQAQNQLGSFSSTLMAKISQNCQAQQLMQMHIQLKEEVLIQNFWRLLKFYMSNKFYMRQQYFLQHFSTLNYRFYSSRTGRFFLEIVPCFTRPWPNDA